MKKNPTSFVLEQFLLETGYPTDTPHGVRFPENEGDSRKLEKLHKLVKHFCEQCKRYVPKKNITHKH